MGDMEELSGLKLLRKISNSKIYIITNQPGITIKEFPTLTKKMAEEVCNYVLDLLKKKRHQIKWL